VSLLKERCGIELSAQKTYLIDARLQAVAERAGQPGVPALLAAIRGAPSSAVVDEALDAMTTNETLFFRDGGPFAHLAELLRGAARANPGVPFRIWSAACATGQEAYSIAITAIETASAARVEILASDVSARCVEAGRRGVFSDFEIQRGLSPDRRDRHFERVADGWSARPRLRETIGWRRHNLLEPLRHPHRFDVIFCRNVLIYFDAPTRAAVLERLADRLAPGGLLYLGGAEAPMGQSPAFRALSNGSGGFVRC
jgi:chemotaxis protein methyltransferase CheR